MEAKEIGRRIQNELMGPGYAEGKDKKRNAFNSVLNDYSEEVCFGRVWARGGGQGLFHGPRGVQPGHRRAASQNICVERVTVDGGRTDQRSRNHRRRTRLGGLRCCR